MIDRRALDISALSVCPGRERCARHLPALAIPSRARYRAPRPRHSVLHLNFPSFMFGLIFRRTTLGGPFSGEEKGRTSSAAEPSLDPLTSAKYTPIDRKEKENNRGQGFRELL